MRRRGFSSGGRWPTAAFFGFLADFFGVEVSV
jgi:hypothetical protein